MAIPGSPRERCSVIFGVSCVRINVVPLQEYPHDPLMSSSGGPGDCCVSIEISCLGIPYIHLQQSSCYLLASKECDTVKPCKSSRSVFGIKRLVPKFHLPQYKHLRRYVFIVSIEQF